MKAMILAAGVGQRMRPLTNCLPKPLLKVGGKPLLQYHLERLATAKVDTVIINLAYLGEKIHEFVGDGSQFGLQIIYSWEPEPLETGGALHRALPLLGESPFLLLNGDVWSDFPIEKLREHKIQNNNKAHLILVPNPTFHPNGDFAIDDNGVIVEQEFGHQPKFTFAGLSVVDPRLIKEYPNARSKFPLIEALRYSISNQQISAEVYRGNWNDVGTPERLACLDAQLKTIQG